MGSLRDAAISTRRNGHRHLLIPSMLIGILFLRTGLAGWLLFIGTRIGIGAVSGFLFGGAIERFEWETFAISSIYALSLWLTLRHWLRLCAPESVRPRNPMPS